MKKLITLMALAVAFCSACKKDKSETASGDNSWTLAGTTYKTAITYKTTTSGGTATILYNFWDATPSATVKVNSLALSFVEAPSASGTYQLVATGQAKTARQFEISAGTTAPLYYAYIGTSVDVQVTVSSGKIKVTLPEVSLKCTTSSPDAKLTGTVQEM
ncbi:hypothetical protein HQ865_24470 [Mucilaginibacter mali]|uniref:Lipocalin-like domain-containing protein n=1 Tax=Mucilaginibacter mali TaxID=2740462 RepID=A0A7D4U0A0_9SPHI|nr:hypothetical protein [Mucilaginibacter mali]QKJ32777.1 hypothetical protein HQ865_24470 [Mucilaginibacter mali]